MNSTKIDDLANACADRVDNGVRTARQCAVLAYKAGFKARRDSIWHTPDDTPEQSGRAIVIITSGNHFRHVTFQGVDKWRFACQSANAVKWTYKSDLL